MARKIRQQICKNCEHSFRIGEKFCPNCGQENHNPNQPIKHYTSELIESFLHLDSKVFFTIATILRYPGKITKEYNENMRARYTSPVKLYVFISLVFFVLLQIPSKEENSSEVIETKDQILVDSNLIGKYLLLDTLQNPNDSIKIISPSDEKDTIRVAGVDFFVSKEVLQIFKNGSPEQIDSVMFVNKLSSNYFTRKICKQFIRSINSDENFEHQIEQKVIKFASFSMFLLMPVFALILFVFYPRRRKFYYEYLIFSIHFHSLVFFILSWFILLKILFIDSNWIVLLVWLGLLFYLAMALRINFGGSKTQNFWKMLIICSSYSLITLMVLLIVLILGWWFV